MSRPRARRGRGEESASLLIAIAFMLVFSLILTAVLQFSATSFKTAGVVADRNKASYAASAALDTLVSRIRRDTTMNIGRQGQTCASVAFTGADSTTPGATATCTPQTNSGAAIPGTDGPATAILIDP